jgi:ABC-type branched-subunit amino acid transport system ATPase component
VVENLRTVLLSSRLSTDAIDERVEAAIGLFSTLQQQRTAYARSLSGGQQQMLALAMALVHQPKVLLIDELSLGLAPVVVQELLAVVERLKADGMTVFMEKGRVCFEGPAQDLLERDDLVRAVFLGGVGA